jgi:ethanolamine permease
VNLVLGVVAILTGRTAEIITLACFGAVALYALSMLALFRLRRAEPDLARPFRAPLYPFAPAVALVLACICLVSLTIDTPRIAAVFFGLLGLGFTYATLALRRPAPVEHT